MYVGSHSAAYSAFQSTLPARGATFGDEATAKAAQEFQSTLPARGATTITRTDGQPDALFQSTLPARGATATLYIGLNDKDISIHAPRTGSDVFRSSHLSMANNISIHAPRTGSDCASARTRYRANYFNPRSPHGERHHRRPRVHAPARFQSTLPARGATTAHLEESSAANPISIHAPRTGSDVTGQNPPRRPAISIHAPRTGSDEDSAANLYQRIKFQSTLPARGATSKDEKYLTAKDFNPRSPHGERRH